MKKILFSSLLCLALSTSVQAEEFFTVTAEAGQLSYESSVSTNSATAVNNAKNDFLQGIALSRYVNEDVLVRFSYSNITVDPETTGLTAVASMVKLSADYVVDLDSDFLPYAGVSIALFDVAISGFTALGGDKDTLNPQTYFANVDLGFKYDLGEEIMIEGSFMLPVEVQATSDTVTVSGASTLMELVPKVSWSLGISYNY